MKGYILFLIKLNFKTIYFNFKYLPWRQAIKFPVVLTNNVSLRKVKGKVIFECPVHSGIVNLGVKGIGIFESKYSRFIWENSGTIVFKGRCNLGQGSKISVGSTGKLVIGDNFINSAELTISVHNYVEIGKNGFIAWDVLIMDSDFHDIKDEFGMVINKQNPIIIGDNVWITCRCLILKNAIIPNNSIVGAGSVISRKLEKENGLYVGNPCKLVKEKISWDREYSSKKISPIFENIH